MTVKEAIGTYKANYLTSHCHKLARLGAPQRVIQGCQALNKKFSAGEFAIYPVSDAIWKIGGYDTTDAKLSSAPVIKVEGAMGHGYHNEPQGILKITTADGVYYYDSEEILSTDTSELFATIDEEFEEITL